MAKYARLDLGQIEAVVNKLGGMEGVEKFLQGKLTVSEPTQNWREEGGVIYLSVTSNGMTGEEWITHLENKNFRVSDWAKSVLRSPDFKPTTGVSYEVGILKGELFSDAERITDKIRLEAVRRKMILPEAEIACLIRENFSDEDIEAMGLWYITTMHEPILDSVGDPRLLNANRCDVGRWLFAYYDRPDYGWDRARGFAFVSQVLST